MRISVINHTDGKLTDLEVLEAIRAVNTQLERDFAPYWHRHAVVRLEGHAHSKQADRLHLDMRGDAVIYIWDKVSPEDAIGYHDLTPTGIPHGFVFLQMADQLEEPWTVTFSHEVLELLMDPEVNLLCAGPHPTEDRDVLFWYEVCDPVQTQHYAIDGVQVSNFVLPLYFTTDDEHEGRNDFLGHVEANGDRLRSFGVANGGYMGYFDPQTGEHETFFAAGDRLAAARAATKRMGRGARRSERYRNIAADATDHDGARPTVRDARAGRQLGFKVEGPWNIGEPVHEVLTLLSIREALVINRNQRGRLLDEVLADRLPSWDSSSAHNLWTNRLHRSLQQFVRGVIWPDDPLGDFFDDETWCEDFSSGIAFARAANADASQPQNLTARSHYGDLQFLHAMEQRAGAAAKDTRQHVLAWAMLLARLAVGAIDPQQRIADEPLLARLFPTPQQHKLPVQRLLLVPKGAPTRFLQQRAAGALLHLIQDSCSAGHVKRERYTNHIEQFLCYTLQDSHCHSKHDQWGPGARLRDRVSSTHGAFDAVRWGSQVLARLDLCSGAGVTAKDRKTSLEALQQMFEQQVFALASGTLPAGAGSC